MLTIANQIVTYDHSYASSHPPIAPTTITDLIMQPHIVSLGPLHCVWGEKADNNPIKRPKLSSIAFEAPFSLLNIIYLSTVGADDWISRAFTDHCHCTGFSGMAGADKAISECRISQLSKTRH